MRKNILSALVVALVMLFILKFNSYTKLNNNDLLGVYLDGELVSAIPKKNEGTYLKSICDDEKVETKWDDDNWGLLIRSMSKKTRCNIYFSSDVEKPSWKVENVSNSNVLTTDIYTVKLVGSDNSKVSSSLDISDMEFLVNDNEYEPISKSLEVLETKEDKVTYELKIHMLKGEGKLVLKLNAGTLIDDSGNKSDNISLDTGINISKNNDTKILVWKDFENRAIWNLKDYYDNLILDNDMSIDVYDIINSKYDVVIYNYPYWEASSKLNDLYNSNINILSQYNDYSKDLLVNDDSQGYLYGDTTADIYSINSNFLNKYLGCNFKEYDTGKISRWHFNKKAIVLYQTTYNDAVYDKIGYLKENDNIWFNIGVSTQINYVPIIEFVMGRLAE